MGEWVYRSTCFDFITSWWWVVSFTPRPLYPGQSAPGTHWIEGWVGPRACLDDAKKRKFLTLPGLELRPLGRPARRESLYRLRYPGSHTPGRLSYTTLRFAKSWSRNFPINRIVIIESILERWDGAVGTALIRLRIRTIGELFEHGNEPSSSIKFSEILE
jgi:hypothetical protein